MVDITAPELLAVVRRIEGRNALGAAHRVLPFTFELRRQCFGLT